MLLSTLSTRADVLVLTMNSLQANLSIIAKSSIMIIEEAARVAEYNIAPIL